MPKPPPPLRPLAVSIAVERLKIVLPVAVVAIVAVALVPGAALLFAHPTAPGTPAPLPAQEWTTGTGALSAFVHVLPGVLPPPDPRQRKPPCRSAIGEEAIEGYCWLRLDISPPCPEGEAWEHNKKCYAYVLRAERTPTSGEPRRAAVADP